MTAFQDAVITGLRLGTGKELEAATAAELYHAVAKAALLAARGIPDKHAARRVSYLSAEFLIGRMVFSNLFNLGLLTELEALLAQKGMDIRMLEDIEDAALGNGGLGRLAACFLDSGATMGLPLDGYGIRYRYGLFRQTFENGFQREDIDDWLRDGDPWSVRREEERVRVTFGDQTVWAVPYDMPVIGYGQKAVNRLRLWQAEPLCKFDFGLFNQQEYAQALCEREMAEAISALLYPNDDTEKGKQLRLKQQYFFASASLQSMLSAYRAAHGEDMGAFADAYAIQLNDTHPVIAIPELIRLLMEQSCYTFEDALDCAVRTFAYTNHTLMAEALETWPVALFTAVVPHVYPYVVMLQNALQRMLRGRGVPQSAWRQHAIIEGGTIHMARMAIFASHSTNGVASLHTELLKHKALKEWYTLYPERFNNKTNGITQRRWLALCNRPLAVLITEKIGDTWVTALDELRRLTALQDDAHTLHALQQIKRRNKQALADHIARYERMAVNPDWLFDVQIKRLHEYKRQLMNAFSILDIYDGLKEGRITAFTPTVFFFGAKAAPGYFRAKAIIKYIHEVARLVNGDPAMHGRMKVVFVHNYNVSYAEKLIPAADVSEQISTAGTEASGTGNMKFMLNGAVTLGTFDGANIEIVQQAGEENNYIFGARVEELTQIAATYDPKAICAANARVRRVVDSLVDGTFSDGGTGMFQELYNALLKGASWHQPDHYFLLHDLPAYVDAKLRVNADFRDTMAFAKKCLLNIAGAGMFSSDRTIAEYARDIWHV